MSRGRPSVFGLIALILAVGLSAATCADLTGPQEGVCGNGILDPGEDCDWGGETRREVGGFGCSACQYLCDDEGACPDDYVCDTDGQLCWAPSYVFARVSDLDLASSSAGPLYTEVTDLRSAELDGAAPRELVILGRQDTEEERVVVAGFETSGELGALSLVQRGLKRGVPLAAGGGEPGTLFVAPHPRAASLLSLVGRKDGTIVPGLGGQWGGVPEGSWLTPGVKQNESGTLGYVALFGDGRSTLAFDGLLGPVVLETPLLVQLDLDLAPGLVLGKRVAVAPLVAGGPELLGVGARSADPAESRVLLYPDVPLFEPLRLTLPPGKNLDAAGGVWFAHTNADEHLDVLVALDDGSTYRAFGLGNYAFTSSLGLAEPDYSLSPVPYIVAAHPLAAGLIDGDDRTDFVLKTQGIALSAPDDLSSFSTPCSNILGDVPYYCGRHGVALDNSDLPTWVEAVLADFNADGRTDVAAVGIDKQVDVFTASYGASGSAVLLPREIPAAGAPRALTVTDLDGDLVSDLAFTVPADDGARALFVSYGAASGAMSDPALVTVANEIADVSSISTGRDLFVLWRDADTEASEAEPASLTWSSVTGGADRAPLAQLLLPCPHAASLTDEELVVPQQLAAGPFLGPRSDVALLYRDCLTQVDAAERLVLIPSTEHGGLAPVLEEPVDLFGACIGEPIETCYQAQRAFRPAGLDLDVPSGFSHNALMLAADVFPGGESEVVLVGPDGDGAQVIVAGALAGGPPRFEVLQQFALDGLAVGGDYDAQGTRGGLAVGDVDGDGWLDLVILTRPTDDGLLPDLLVVPGSADGLDPDALVPLGELGVWPSAFESSYWGSVSDVRAFALLDVNDDKVIDALVVASPTDLASISATWDEELSEGYVSKAYGVPGVTRLTVGHFDGDNLLDFAAATSREALVFRQQPRVTTR